MSVGIAVVVVCHDNVEEVPVTLAAVLDQMGPGDEIIVVDNASGDGTAEAAMAIDARVKVVETGANLGFTGGCHAGARASGAELLLFLNPDAVPLDGCLAQLRAADVEWPGWAAWQAVVCLEDGEHVNSAGNPVHYLGFAWAGRLDEPVASLPVAPHVTGSLSGAALTIRRTAWDAIGGFDDEYFMYGEDVDLCLRLRLAGQEVGVVPAARVRHSYSYEKGAYKWFYLERNRWRTVVGDYPTRLLLLLLPALLAFELALLAAATRGGWLRPKLEAQRTLLREVPALARRRRRVQRTRQVDSAAFAAMLTDSLDSPNLAGATRLPGLQRAQAAYWRAVKALL